VSSGFCRHQNPDPLDPSQHVVSWFRPSDFSLPIVFSPSGSEPCDHDVLSFPEPASLFADRIPFFPGLVALVFLSFTFIPYSGKRWNSNWRALPLFVLFFPPLFTFGPLANSSAIFDFLECAFLDLPPSVTGPSGEPQIQCFSSPPLFSVVSCFGLFSNPGRVPRR